MTRYKIRGQQRRELKRQKRELKRMLDMQKYLKLTEMMRGTYPGDDKQKEHEEWIIARIDTLTWELNQTL